MTKLGWPTGIEPAQSAPQAEALPLSYGQILRVSRDAAAGLLAKMPEEGMHPTRGLGKVS